jgi:hypothetical protein
MVSKLVERGTVGMNAKEGECTVGRRHMVHMKSSELKPVPVDEPGS